MAIGGVGKEDLDEVDVKEAGASNGEGDVADLEE